jgi:SSS family solute:Na+ symporter
MPYLSGGGTPEKFEAAVALARAGDPDDVPRLTALLDDPDLDARVGAATAVLQLERQRQVTLGGIDWAVIGIYALGMLAIGWYYSGQQANAEEYLLGGRRLGAVLVGISLFATLFSTLSYLSIPGEILSKGPTYLASFLAYPFIIAVIGWMLIPFIMRLRVTTAYEILEHRFGLWVRLTGSVMFLTLRLLWMATIMYATVDLVLMPLTGLDPRAAPLVYVVLLGVTVVYTTMGGLKAVVVTDALQALILFAGALAPVLLITWQLGGVSAWWPQEWASHWEPFRLAPDFSSRMTAFTIALDAFIWYVCTNGSDQMSVQRFLSTRDVVAARRSMFTAMAANGAVLLLLAVVGFALLGYFRANPHLLAAGQSLDTGADKLFPQYIVIGLPVGASGLVIAGILAAAMSSLSSGVTACASIVTVDLFDRLGMPRPDPAGEVRRARLVSLAVGVLVLFLSGWVARVPGNLLDVIYKVVNLLTVPLFILFFMAMFVPWANGFGTLAGTAASLAVAVGIAFFQWGKLEVFWMMPMALAAGVLVGPVASLLPVGPPGRPMPAG